LPQWRHGALFECGERARALATLPHTDVLGYQREEALRQRFGSHAAASRVHVCCALAQPSTSDLPGFYAILAPARLPPSMTFQQTLVKLRVTRPRVTAHGMNARWLAKIYKKLKKNGGNASSGKRARAPSSSSSKKKRAAER